MRNDETRMPFVEFPNSHLGDRDASMLGSVLKPKTRQDVKRVVGGHVFFFFFLNGHGIANVENPRHHGFFHELRAELFITEDFLKFFWLTCLTNDFLAISHFSERKGGKKGIAL